MLRKLIITIVILCHTNVWAQQDTIKSKVHILRTVVVTSNKNKRSVQSVVPYYSISQDNMQAMGIVDIADALHRLPGIILCDYGGAGGMKTVSVRGFGTQHTAVSYDGMLLNNVQTGSIDLARYSLSNIDNLTLTIGNNDNIFISAQQAIAPTLLSVNTMQDIPRTCNPHFDSRLKIGSFGYISPSVRYIQRLSSWLSLSAFVEYIHADNNYPFSLKNVSTFSQQIRQNCKMNSSHIEANIHYQPLPYHYFMAKAYYYNSHRQLPGIVRYYTNDSKETLQDENSFIQLQYRYQGKGHLTCQWGGKYDRTKTIYTDANYVDLLMDAQYIQQQWYTFGSVMYAVNSYLSVNYALDYLYNTLHSSLKTDVLPSRHSLLQCLSTKFSTNRITLVARLSGSMYFNHTEIGSSASNVKQLLPMLSVSYKLLPHFPLFLRVSYKRGFRMPTFNENYFFHYGSKDVNPELTNQINLGFTYLKQTPLYNISTTIDGYINHVTDKIVGIPYNMFIWRTVNIGKVRMLGVDINQQISWQMTHCLGLTGSVNYSYLQAVDRTLSSTYLYNMQIAYMPKHTMGMSLTLQNPIINMVIHGIACSNRWATNEHILGTKLKAYTEWGCSVYRKFSINKQLLTIKLDVKNIFNRQYDVVAGYPMPGIQYQISTRYKF